MRLDSKFRNDKIRKSERGYMLITLMLAVALMMIALLAVLPSVRQQVQREREEELQHRGTAYMRAIQHFYKKFGKYPTRIEELENTNNLRYLRKRYKDPVNRDAEGKEKDFKFLRQQDVLLNNGPVLGQIPGQTPANTPGGPNPSQTSFGSNPQNALGGAASLLGGMTAQTGGLQQAGATATPSDENADSANAAGSEGNANGTGSTPSSNGGSSSSSGFNGPTFGGGPIIGVRSENKKEKAVHIFFTKNHYNDWLFIYVPQGDRGGLLTGPVNPNMPTGNLNGAAPGQTSPNGIQPGVTPNPAVPNAPAPQQQNPGQTSPDQ